MNAESITENMLRFKEAVRHLWNTYLLDSVSSMSPDLQLSFELIEQELFRSIVILPSALPIAPRDYRQIPLPIWLRPKSGLLEIPVQFGSTDASKNMIWKVPCTVSAAEVSKYRFIEFFDWNPYDYIDLSYIKAMTPDKGCALISQIHCEFTVAAQSQ